MTRFAQTLRGRARAPLRVLPRREFQGMVYALALTPVPSPVTELAARSGTQTILIRLFEGILANSEAELVQKVQQGLQKWRAAEVGAHGQRWRPMVMTLGQKVADSAGGEVMEPNPDYEEDYILPPTIQLGFKELGLGAEGSIFAHLTRTPTVASLFSSLKKATLAMPDDLDFNEQQTWAYPASPNFPTFDLTHAESLDKGRDLFDALQSNEELAGGDEGLRVAGEHSVEIAEVVLLRGQEGSWEEVTKVALVE